MDYRSKVRELKFNLIKTNVICFYVLLIYNKNQRLYTCRLQLHIFLLNFNNVFILNLIEKQGEKNTHF